MITDWQGDWQGKKAKKLTSSGEGVQQVIEVWSRTLRMYSVIPKSYQDWRGYLDHWLHS
jgi:hypothetical protein